MIERAMVMRNEFGSVERNIELFALYTYLETERHERHNIGFHISILFNLVFANSKFQREKKAELKVCCTISFGLFEKKHHESENSPNISSLKHLPFHKLPSIRYDNIFHRVTCSMMRHKSSVELARSSPFPFFKWLVLGSQIAFKAV